MMELIAYFIFISSVLTGAFFWLGYIYGFKEHKRSSDYLLKRLFGDCDY